MDGWKHKLKLRMPALILFAATVLFWSFYDRYRPVGGPLLNASMERADVRVRGDISLKGAAFRLHVPDGGRRAQIDFPLPESAAESQFIRLRGRVKLEGVVEGKHGWNRARILLAQYDRNRKWIPGLAHGVMGESGSREWEMHEEVFEIHTNCAHVAVILQQSGSAGTAFFDQLEAYPVSLRSSFTWWRIWFAASWLGMAVLYFTRCRLHQRRLKVVILLNVIAILAGTLLPGAWIIEGTAWVKEGMQNMRPPRPPPAKIQSTGEQAKPAAPAGQEQVNWFEEVEVRSHQAGHFILFASLCFLVYLSAALEQQHPVYFFKVGFDILLFAAITESIQLLTPDRTAGLADLRIDLYGMGVALLLFVALLPLIRRIPVKPS